MVHKKIKKTLHHVFIPHVGNDYKPHFFREHAILSMLISVIVLLLISFTTSFIIRTTTVGSSVVSSVLIDLTNQNRKINGLPPLLYNQKLTIAAKMKGEDMVKRNYFSHFAPDGTSPWYWFKEVKYPFIFAGENLAINFRSSKEVEQAWMNSPKHKENILDSRFEDIGIATAPGVVNSKKVLFVVQMFGKPEPTSIENSIFPKTPPLVMFYEKLLFNTSYYISTIYTTLIMVLVIALSLMVFIEIRKQHIYHILYGVLLMLVVLICLGINSYLI